ncbi:MAG TPA: hypothetical protein VJU61_16875 [Polyangiaceae bacterium]|nr:hypothetical protein [Polyangiaceae bacterium]
MAWNPYPPLPLGAVRDLLGITRALYRAALDDEPRDAARLEALEEIGRTLQSVLKEPRSHPGTIAAQNARAAAERATARLRELVGEGQLLAPLLAATAKRLARAGAMVSP